MKVYECYFNLKYQVTAQNLTVENANNLIKKFREKLNTFSMERGPLVANVVYPTDIIQESAQQINNSLAEGSYSGIRMNIVDHTEGEEAITRFNNVTRAQVSQALMGIEIDYYNTSLKVVKVGYN